MSWMFLCHFFKSGIKKNALYELINSTSPKTYVTYRMSNIFVIYLCNFREEKYIQIEGTKTIGQWEI